MKILFLFLFFSIQGHTQALETKTITLPADLAGVKLNNENDNSISIDITYKIVDEFVKVRETKRKSIISFFENLMWIYKNKDKNKLLGQFVGSTQKEVEALPNFKTQFEVVSLIRRPYLKSIQKFKKGFLLRWSDESFLDERKIYIIRKGDIYKIAKMNISKDDKYFWNSNLFFKYITFQKKKAQIKNAFNSITDNEIKSLEVSLDKGFDHLNIFKEGDELVNLIALDNYSSDNYPFKDIDKKRGKVKLLFSGKNFKKKGEYKIHLIQSTYPLGALRPIHFKNSSSFSLIKK